MTRRKSWKFRGSGVGSPINVYEKREDIANGSGRTNRWEWVGSPESKSKRPPLK